jgi:diacylglycerol kinase (ATP)
MLHTLNPDVQLELDPAPRVAVVPLGTGNDLSLSFGWGNAFLPAWLRNFPSVYHMLRRVADAQPRELDCWRISLRAGEQHFATGSSSV